MPPHELDKFIPTGESKTDLDKFIPKDDQHWAIEAAKTAGDLLYRATPMGAGSVMKRGIEKAGEAFQTERGGAGAVNEMLRATGEAALPALIPAAGAALKAAPLAMGAGMLGGYASGRLGRRAAEAMGAPPDVADIVEFGADVAFPGITAAKILRRGAGAAARAVQPQAAARKPIGLLEAPRNIRLEEPPRIEPDVEPIPYSERPKALPPARSVQAPPVEEPLSATATPPAARLPGEHSPMSLAEQGLPPSQMDLPVRPSEAPSMRVPETEEKLYKDLLKKYKKQFKDDPDAAREAAYQELVATAPRITEPPPPEQVPLFASAYEDIPEPRRVFGGIVDEAPSVGRAAEAAAAPKSTEGLIVDALERQMGGVGGIARVSALRSDPALSGIGKKEFDDTVVKLVREGVISPHTHNAPYRLPEAERKNLVASGVKDDLLGEQFYVALGLREVPDRFRTGASRLEVPEPPEVRIPEGGRGALQRLEFARERGSRVPVGMKGGQPPPPVDVAPEAIPASPEPQFPTTLEYLGFRPSGRYVPGTVANLDPETAVRAAQSLRKTVSKYAKTDPKTGLTRPKGGTLKAPPKNASPARWEAWRRRNKRLDQLNQLERQLSPEDFKAFGGKGPPRFPARSGQAAESIPPEPESAVRTEDPYKGIPESALPRGRRLARYGKPGEELSRKLRLADDLGEMEADDRTFRLQRSGLHAAASDPEADVAMFDALEGKTPSRPLSPAEQQVVDEARRINQEIAQEAMEAGREGGPIQLLTPAGEWVQFSPRQDFAPHVIPRVEVLADKTHPIYKDIVEHNLKGKLGMSDQEAAAYIDEYVQWVERGDTPSRIVKHMIDTGQADNVPAAEAMLEKFRIKRPSSYGHIERTRVVDLPLYDPKISRAMPQYVAGASRRLAQIKTLGQENETVNALLEEIRSGKGPGSGYDAYQKAKQIVELIQRRGPRHGQTAEKLSLAARAFETQAHIGLSTAIPNMLQATLWGTVRTGFDVPTVAKGISRATTRAGREASRRSGAVHESAMRHLMQETGASPGRLQRLLNKWVEQKLKLTGFAGSEEAQRHIAYAIGEEYAKKLARQVAKEGADSRAGRELIDLGIDPARVSPDLKLSQKDLNLAGKRLSDMINFRTRPIDLPHLVDSPEMRLFWQFKNYMHNASLETYRATIGEAANGRVGPALSNLFKMGVLFGVSGAVVETARSMLRGFIEGGPDGAVEELDTKIEEYGEDPIKKFIFAAGQLGLGAVFIELWQSAKYHRTVEAFAGPVFSTGADLFESMQAMTEEGKVFPFADWIAERVGLFADFLWPSIKEDIKKDLGEGRQTKKELQRAR